MLIVGFYTVRQGNVMALPLMFILVPLILLGMLWGSDTQSNVDQYIIPGPVKRRTIVLSIEKANRLATQEILRLRGFFPNLVWLRK